MKATTTLPSPALPYKPRVKKCLIKGIICLISKIFAIFVNLISVLICWTGVCVENDRIVAYACAGFLIGFTTWSMRETIRDMRQDSLGLKKW